MFCVCNAICYGVHNECLYVPHNMLWCAQWMFVYTTRYAMVCIMNVCMYHTMCYGVHNECLYVPCNMLWCENECLHVPCLLAVLPWTRWNNCPDIATCSSCQRCNWKWAYALTLCNTIAWKCFLCTSSVARLPSLPATYQPTQPSKRNFVLPFVITLILSFLYLQKMMVFYITMVNLIFFKPSNLSVYCGLYVGKFLALMNGLTCIQCISSGLETNHISILYTLWLHQLIWRSVNPWKLQMFATVCCWQTHLGHNNVVHKDQSSWCKTQSVNISSHCCTPHYCEVSPNFVQDLWTMALCTDTFLLILHYQLPIFPY